MYLHDPIQTWCVHLLGECSELIRFWATLAKFWPLNDWKCSFPTIIWKSIHAIQFEPWCVHLLGEYSELIRFWDTLTKFWPSSGHKMTENGRFQPLPEKLFTQFNSKLMCTLIEWVFRTDSLLGHVGQILAFKYPKNYWKWWFSTIIWKNIHGIQFKHDVYT